MNLVKRIRKEEDIRVTRTLFIYDIQSEAENCEIKEFLKTFGDLYETYSFREDCYQVIFAIFYDLRTSEQCYKALKEKNKNVLFTVSKYEIPRGVDKCDENKNQGTIVLMSRSLNEPLDESEIRTLLEQFGEIKACRDYKPYQKFIEFFDTRCAVNAWKQVHESKYKEGSLIVRFSWDVSTNLRWNMIKEVDRILKSNEINTSLSEGTLEEAVPKVYEKNLFLKLWDDFIVENLSEIEKWI